MFKAIARFIFYKLMGWSVKGSFPKDIKKFILTVAPHTSNWDFPVGVIGRSVTDLSYAKYLGKKELFKPPFGWIFYALGGYPVDRSKNTNLVDAVAEIFEKHDRFVIAMAPEGTRSRVDRLKTGFYYIAKKAQVPVVMVGFDYQDKTISISEPFYTTDDFERDMNYIWNYYKDIKGKIPELGIN